MKRLCLLLLPLLAACATHTQSTQPAPTAETVASHEAANANVAREIFGMTFASDARPQSSANRTGIRTNDLLFSRRVDSRTYFMQDLRRTEPGNHYQGSDEQLMTLATTMLRNAGIPEREIASRRVLQMLEQSANVDRPNRRVIRMMPVAKAGRIAELGRQIAGVPVFSSRVVVMVNAEGRPSFAEVHWPVVPDDVVREALRLRALVAGGWKPQDVRGARVDRIEAGIIHSPAPAFVMDIAPVIRVTLTSTDKPGGKKPVLYFDRAGRLIAPPRTFPGVQAACPVLPRTQKR